MFENKAFHILSNTEIFKGLANDDFKKIYSCCQKVRFVEKDTLIKEGQIKSTLYIIIEGQVEVILPEQNKEMGNKRVTKVKLTILNKGDFFGEYSFFDSEPSSASVVATQSGELIKITKFDLNNTLKNNDRIAKTIYLNMLQILIKRLRNTNKEYDEIYLL